MHLLFICSRNQWRSRTAETLYRNHPDHWVKSAGTASSARIKVSQKLVDWAEVIFVMEKKHQDLLLQRFSKEGLKEKIIVLDIPDEYTYMDEELVELLQSSVDGFLDFS